MLIKNVAKIKKNVVADLSSFANRGKIGQHGVFLEIYKRQRAADFFLSLTTVWAFYIIQFNRTLILWYIYISKIKFQISRQHVSNIQKNLQIYICLYMALFYINDAKYVLRKQLLYRMMEIKNQILNDNVYNSLND